MVIFLNADEIIEAFKHKSENHVPLWVACIRWAKLNNREIPKIFDEKTQEFTSEFTAFYESYINETFLT